MHYEKLVKIMNIFENSFKYFEIKAMIESCKNPFIDCPPTHTAYQYEPLWSSSNMQQQHKQCQQTAWTRHVINSIHPSLSQERKRKKWKNTGFITKKFFCLFLGCFKNTISYSWSVFDNCGPYFTGSYRTTWRPHKLLKQ